MASITPLHVVTDLDTIFEAHRAAFARHPYPGVRERREHLDALRRILVTRGDDIADAISDDFGHRSRTETQLLELFPSLESVKHARANVARWMRPVRSKTSMWFFPGRSRVIRQPVGVAGVIVPWNYPVNMTFGPLAGAIAAGNRVMVKISEFTPRTGELFAKLFSAEFETDHIAIINGDVDVARAFSSKPFDHLLFTGSTSVGRDVMRTASANLTPVTLELGGKSPAIIANGFDVATAARRIMLGKCVNAGQTCIAPDYVLIEADRIDQFVAAATAAAREFYPEGAGSEDYSSIVNARHFARLESMLAEAEQRGARANVLIEGTNSTTRKLAPVIVTGVRDDMRIMQEEIFGPLLPVVPYRTHADAIQFVRERPHPLAMYYFDNDTARTERTLQSSIAGGVSVNDTLCHFAQEGLPFGGVGASGMGNYHGEHGFNTFSVQKGVYYRTRFNTTRLLEPPYGSLIARALKRVLR